MRTTTSGSELTVSSQAERYCRPPSASCEAHPAAHPASPMTWPHLLQFKHLHPMAVPSQRQRFYPLALPLPLQHFYPQALPSPIQHFYKLALSSPIQHFYPLALPSPLQHFCQQHIPQLGPANSDSTLQPTSPSHPHFNTSTWPCHLRIPVSVHPKLASPCPHLNLPVPSTSYSTARRPGDPLDVAAGWRGPTDPNKGVPALHTGPPWAR